MFVNGHLSDFTKVKEASEVQSFIFSPPAQPRSRRSSVDREPSQLATEEHSILLPPSTSREPTHVRSREATPVKSTSKRGRPRKGSTSEISVPPIPEEPPGITMETDTPVESEPPAKEKRPKRG